MGNCRREVKVGFRVRTTDGELTHAYSVEEGGESKLTKSELITMIESAGFEAVERDTVYNRVEKLAA
jgi:2-iminoacetate synthase ThiH